MAVSIVSSPDPHALSQGGRTTFVFQGAGRVASSGLKAVNGLSVTGAIADGTVINFRWNGITHAVVAKTSPAAPNEFPAGDGSKAYVDSLTTFFGEYFHFQEDFVVTRGDDLGSFRPITFTAKQPGIGYTFTIEGGIGKPYVIGINTKGADQLTRSQYSVYCELWVQNVGQNADYERVFRAPLETDATGLAQFDVGDLLHAQLTDDLPIWNFATPQYGAKSARNYYIRFGEAYGSPVQIGKMKTDTTRRIYRGGVDFVHKAGSGTSLVALSQTRIVDTIRYRALRQGSGTRYVYLDEPQYLTFVNTTNADAPAPVSLSVNLVCTDSTEVTAIVPYDPVAMPKGAKWTFPVGVGQLKLLDKVPAGKTLREYSVQLISVTDYSPAYRFIINGQYEPYTRYFGYVNSLGSLETLATFGKGSSELTLFAETAERYLPSGYDIDGGQFVQYDLQLQQQTEVTTGFRSAAELRGWADFYRSPLKFHLRAGSALPIGIVSKSIKQGKDADNLYAHTFQFQYAYRDDFYTVSADDEAALGDAIPPRNFSAAGGGSVVIQPAIIVPSVDKTVPDVVRTLTVDKILSFEVTKTKVDLLAATNPLDEARASSLFRRLSDGIDFIRDVTNKPNTRDGYLLSDVPTVKEAIANAVNLFPLRLELSSSLSASEPGIRVRKPIGEGWEYSLNKTNWQAQPLFARQGTGNAFVKGQSYAVYARNAALDASVQGSIIHGATTNLDDKATLNDPLRWGRGTVLDPVLKNFSDDFPDFA